MAKLVSRWRRNHRLAPPYFQSAYAGWVHLAEVDLAWQDALRRDLADRTRARFESDVDALVDFVTTQGRMPTIVERDSRFCRLARFAERCRSRMLADEMDAASIIKIVASVVLGSWWHDVEFARRALKCGTTPPGPDVGDVVGGDDLGPEYEDAEQDPGSSPRDVIMMHIWRALSSANIHCVRGSS